MEHKVIFLILVLVLCLPVGASQANKSYPGELFFEHVALFFIFEPYEKAQLLFSYLGERLSEAAGMAEQREFEYIEQVLYSSLYTDAMVNAIANFADEPKLELDRVLLLENALETYEVASSQFLLDYTRAMTLSLGAAESEDIEQMLASEQEKLREALAFKKARTLTKLKAVYQYRPHEAENHVRERYVTLGIAQQRTQRMAVVLMHAQQYNILARQRLEEAHDRGYNTDDIAGHVDSMQQIVQQARGAYGSDFERLARLAHLSRQTSMLILSEKNYGKFEQEHLNQARNYVLQASLVGNTTTIS